MTSQKSPTSPVTSPSGDPVKFVLRRAFRIGSVTRQDLMSAFALPGASASRVIQAALAHHPKLLLRDGHALRPRLGAPVPVVAGEADLMATLDTVGNDYRLTGIDFNELYVNRVQWSSSLPAKQDLLLPIVRAAAETRPLRVQYVGLARGESARWRFLQPMGLERMGDQWRLLAADLEAPGFPIKVFVLARITDVIDNREKRPKGFVPGLADDRSVTVAVAVNPLLTTDQRKVVGHEMALLGGTAKIPRRSEFEYRRRFTATPENSAAVWPLASSITVEKT